jgi:hypothetical protein
VLAAICAIPIIVQYTHRNYKKGEERNMQKLIYTVLLALVTIGNVKAELSCGDVYAGAVRNVSVSTRNKVESNYLFSQHCENNGEMRTGSSSQNLSVAVAKKINLGFSGTNAEAITTIKNFCKTYVASSSSSSQAFDLEDLVVSEALKTFNECRQLEINNVFISHSIQDPRSVIVKIDFNPGKTKLHLRSIDYDADVATCRTTALSSFSWFGNPEPEVITEKMKESEIDRPFSITCVRTPENDSNKFPRFTLGVDTNHGTYSLSMPVEEMLGYDLAHQNKVSILALNKRINTLSDNNTSLVSQLRQAKGNATNLTNRLSRVTVEIHHVMVGRYSRSPWPHLQCTQRGGQGVNSYASGVCGANRAVIDLDVLSSVSGDTCGYSLYQFACLKK